jgi:hypothetical protein
MSEAFLGGIIDYAGLFPPAQLPLDQAIRNYARYRTLADAWLLGRFVCPAARLGELVPLNPGTSLGTFPFSVLGRGGKDAQEYLANVKADFADVARFAETTGDKARVETYEIRLPASAFNPLRADQISSLVATTAHLIEVGWAGRGPDVFFEAPVTDRDALVALIQALHDDRQSSEARGRRRCGPVGFKLRTGGLEAAAFPSSEQVALVLAACAAARVPFKATAGLHHPFRHFSAQVNATMHGFVNVFVAGCLALVHRLDDTRIRRIIDDEDPAHFRLGPGGLSWQDLAATPEEVTGARLLFTSFGSCSFDEPREDLRRYGWLAS